MSVTICYKFPDEWAERIITAFCGTYGYVPTVPDPDHPGQSMPNPETPAAFARRKVADYVKDVVVMFECNVAVKQTAEQTTQNVKADIDAADIQIEAIQEPEEPQSSSQPEPEPEPPAESSSGQE